MPILVNCPSCQRIVRVPDTLIGQHVRCPTCEATFVASQEMAVAESAIVEPHAVEGSGPERPPASEPRPTIRSREAAAPPRPVGVPAFVKPHRGVLILILGILSIVVSCCGLILGPIAWIMGATDLREIRGGRMDREGEGLTSAGRICGIIGTCLGAFSCCCGSGSAMRWGFHPHRFRF